MKKQLTQCFVCGIDLKEGSYNVHEATLLPECDDCKNTDKERAKVSELLDSLAEDFICGCI